MHKPDIVSIHNLTFDTIVGVLAHERSTEQPLRIDLDMEVDLTKAARTKHLGDTVDYASIAKDVRELTVASKPLLLETLAQEIADYLLEHPLIAAVKIQVSKPEALPGDAVASVTIHRGG